MNTNMDTTWPIPPKAALMACTPVPTARLAQYEKIHSNGRCDASMPRIATVATMVRLVVSTAMPADMIIFSNRVCVRLIGTVGRRECQGPISLSV